MRFFANGTKVRTNDPYLPTIRGVVAGHSVVTRPDTGNTEPVTLVWLAEPLDAKLVPVMDRRPTPTECKASISLLPISSESLEEDLDS